MLRMVRFELKKLLGSAAVRGCLAALAVVCAMLLQAYCFQSPAVSALLPDGTQLSGREAVLYHQAVARRYEGDFTDATIARMAADLAAEDPQTYAALKRGGAVSAALPAPYLYLAMFLPPQEGGVPLTEYGTIGLRDYGAAFLDKPLQYGYGDSWALFVQGFCGSTIAAAAPALLVVVVAVSGVFSGEYAAGTDALLLTARRGRGHLVAAKLLASLIFATLVVGGVFLIFAAAFGVQFGPAGWSADMQTNLGLSLLSVELPWSNLQLVLESFAVAWMAGAAAACVSAGLSAVTGTPFASLMVCAAAFAAPGVLRQLLDEGLLRDVLAVFPVNAVRVLELLRLPAVEGSLFSGAPHSPVIAVGAVAAAAAVLSGAAGVKCFCRGRQ